MNLLTTKDLDSAERDVGAPLTLAELAMPERAVHETTAERFRRIVRGLGVPGDPAVLVRTSLAAQRAGGLSLADTHERWPHLTAIADLGVADEPDYTLRWADAGTPDQKLAAKATALAAQRGCSFGEGMRLAVAADPELAASYLEEAEPAADDSDEKLAEAATRIASERNVGYGEALVIALAEDPALADNWQKHMLGETD